MRSLFVAVLLVASSVGHAIDLQCAGAFTPGAQVFSGSARVTVFSVAKGRKQTQEPVSILRLKKTAARTALAEQTKAAGRTARLIPGPQIIRVDAPAIGVVDVALPSVLQLANSTRQLETWAKATAGGIEETTTAVIVDGYAMTYKIESSSTSGRTTTTINFVNEAVDDGTVALRIVRVGIRRMSGSSIEKTDVDIVGAPPIVMRAPRW